MNRIILVLGVVILSLQFSYSQKIEKIKAQQTGNYISIYYDIVNANESQAFDVEVYCSTNGGSSWGSPLQKVRGDVGDNIKGGSNHKIIWDVLGERNELVGKNIKFKVKASTRAKSSAGFSSFPLNRPE